MTSPSRENHRKHCCVPQRLRERESGCNPNPSAICHVCPPHHVHAERFVPSVKDECLSKLIPIGPAMQERSLREYVNHYHRERNHQGVGNQLITPMTARHHVAQTIVRRPRLGGILNFYLRAAA